MKVRYNPKLKELARGLRKKRRTFRSFAMELLKKETNERVSIHEAKTD